MDYGLAMAPLSVKAVIFRRLVSYTDSYSLARENDAGQANVAAHRIAYLVKSVVTTKVWHEDYPLWLLDIVSNDLS